MRKKSDRDYLKGFDEAYYFCLKYFDWPTFALSLHY